MPVYVASTLAVSSPSVPYLIKDSDVRGGYRSVPDLVTRDSIHFAQRTTGMRVLVTSNNTVWTVALPDPFTWIQVFDDAVRQSFQFIPGSAMAPAGQVDFEVPTGKSCMLINLTVSDPQLQVEAHGLTSRADNNPFTFVSYVGHLADDGTSKLLDETIQFNRRFAMIANLEGVPTSNTYWRLINNGPGTVTPTIDIEYLTVEQ